MKRKLLIAFGAFVALFLALLVVGYYLILGSNKPIEDGAQFNAATVVVDVPRVGMYLLDAGDGKFVLVDGGVDQKAEAVSKVLKGRKASLSNIVAVVLTHGHSDHMGAAYGLTGVPLYVHEDDVQIAEGTVAPTSPLSSLAGPNPKGLKVTNTFSGGDKLQFGKLTMEVFHTPGHTAGNCAFLVDGVLLLGDTAQVTTDDQLTTPPDIFTADPKQAIESIRALGKSVDAMADKPKWLAPAHSGATMNIDALTSF